MKRNILAYILTLLALPILSASAQLEQLDRLEFRNNHSFILNNEYTVTTDLVFDRLQLGANQLLIVTLELKDTKSGEVTPLRPIFIAGTTRAKVMDREQWLHNERSYMDRKPFTIITRKNNKPQSLNYIVTLPLEDWMRHATLTYRAELIGCAECGKGEGVGVITEQLLFSPDYKASFIIPEAEPVKTRADRYSAIVAYRVDKSDIDPNYMANPAVLEEVNTIVAKILSNPDLTVSDIYVKGYSSPEATVAYNQALSERRSNGFADYLIARHGIARSKMKVKGMGEDWEATRELIAEDKEVLTPEERAQVLEIIDTVADKDGRDAPLKALDGGATYQKLLQQIYPRVRRTEYGFSYVVRPFNVEEAKQVLRTNPKLLSLNEMYLVANSYDPESKEFKEVFDIAAKQFPNEPVALINASASDLENGKVSKATDKLLKMKEDPRAWNNLAITYALQGDAEAAQALFQKAVEAGDPLAKDNLKELRKLMDFKNSRENSSNK